MNLRKKAVVQFQADAKKNCLIVGSEIKTDFWKAGGYTKIAVSSRPEFLVPENLHIYVRHSDDPYLAALRLTDNSFNFGGSSTKFYAGGGIVAVITIWAIYIIYVIYKPHKSKGKGKGKGKNLGDEEAVMDTDNSESDIVTTSADIEMMETGK